MLLLVAVIVGALVASGIGGRVACAVGDSVSRIAGGEGAECEGGGDKPVAGPGDGADTDTDGDGISDADEQRNGTDPASADTDGDGLTDAEEAELGTNPRSHDTDGDGLRDGDELDLDTDPFGSDTDGDGKDDGEDGDPLVYDGGLGDGVKGAVCGGATTLFCPDEDDPVRATDEYVIGEILTGLFAVGDVRDAIGALIDGKFGDAFWAAVGIVPVAGDAVKIGRKIRSVITKFPARRGQLLGLLIKLFPDGALKRQALDVATDGGYTALRNSGLSDEAVEQLAKRGNDLRRIADNARVGARTLDPTEARALEDAVTKHWPPARRSEAYGVESALTELRRDPNIEILYDGRPAPACRSTAPTSSPSTGARAARSSSRRRAPRARARWAAARCARRPAGTA